MRNMTLMMGGATWASTGNAPDTITLEEKDMALFLVFEFENNHRNNRIKKTPVRSSPTRCAISKSIENAVFVHKADGGAVS
jgi:hypothetical protein